MRREELIKKIKREAKRQGVAWKVVEGGKHDAIWLGSVKSPSRDTPRSVPAPQKTSCTNASPS